MKEIEVKIVKLERMIVASSYAFSESPEAEAMQKLHNYVKPKGLLNDLENNPFFGFALSYL